MTFPSITLPSAHTAQTSYSSDAVSIIKIEDQVEERSLRAFVQLGDNPSFKKWVTVLSGDAYTVDWTNDQVAAAVAASYA